MDCFRESQRKDSLEDVQTANTESVVKNIDLSNQILDKLIRSFLNSYKHFTVQELGNALGLNYKGTEKLIKILIRNGTILDVTFGEKNPKYIKAKPEETKNNNI